MARRCVNRWRRTAGCADHSPGLGRLWSPLPWRSVCRWRRIWRASAPVITPNGNSAWSAPTTRPSAPRGSTRRSSPSTGWWRARLEQQWEAALERRGAAAGATTRASRPARRAPCRTPSARASANWPQTFPPSGRRPRPPPAERQAIVRQLIERVIVTVIDDSERVDCGGALDRRSPHPHAPRAPGRAPGAAQLLPRTGGARSILTSGRALRCPEIAGQLNAEGWRPAKRRETFNGPMVASLLVRQGVSAGTSPPRAAPWPERAPEEWALSELAHAPRDAASDALQLAAQRLADRPAKSSAPATANG